MKSNVYKRIYIILLILLTTWIGFSCQEDKLQTDNLENGTEVSFQIKTLKTTVPKMLTKSGDIASENVIAEIQVLVFENDLYKYRVNGYNIVEDGNNKTSFKARIAESNASTTLYIIANATASIVANEPIEGENITTTIRKINQSFTANGVNSDLPMWGEYQLPNGIITTEVNNLSGINMLRAVARVDVVCSSTVPLVLASVQAFRIANQMQIIPDAPSVVPDVTSPSIPEQTSYSVQTNPIPTTTDTSSRAQLYIPESAAPETANAYGEVSCIIVGGYYNGSSTLSYYRLDFNPGIDGYPLGQILRNHRYEFNILNISGEGFATAAEAAGNAPAKIEASIILWKDFIHNIVFNDNEYFGISRNLVILSGKINTTLDLLTETNVTDYTICWANSGGTPSDTPSGTSITNDYFQVSKQSGDILQIETLKENPIGSGIRNIRYVLVQANELSMLLTLLQEPDEFKPGDAKWAITNTDMPGTFAPNIGDAGMIYQWNQKIAWPATGSVSGWDFQGAGGMVWTDANDPCPPGYRVPSSQELNGLLKESPGQHWISGYSGDEGFGNWFAPTKAEAESATFSNPGNAIFLPAAGGRNSGGTLSNQNSNGLYWADDLDQGGVPYSLVLAEGNSQVLTSESRAAGYFVRCVRANN